MKTVFVDVDTQIDFLFPAGALYVPGAERLLPAIARLNHFAAAQGIPLISTTDAHREDDMASLQFREDDYAWVTGEVRAIAERHADGRMVSVLEGGYALSALGRSVVAHLRALGDI